MLNFAGHHTCWSAHNTVLADRIAFPYVSPLCAGMGNSGGAIDLGEFMSRVMPGARGKPRTEKRTLPIKEARAVLEVAEIEARLASQDLRREAVALAEQNGIVVIDEIDKIISNKSRHSGDASAEGVQRDLLPLIEGTTVEVRRFGNVKTDYMLFIACGAFHEVRACLLIKPACAF